MSLLSMVESKLPAGFRFHPRDDELICDYLAPKLGIENHKLGLLSEALIDINLNICEPWDLPETARVGGKDWYFFSQRDRKYATGHRTNRATVMGYWKATGKDRRVTRKGFSVGMRKTLVFYRGRAPKGKKTEWVMHEYRVESKDGSSHLTCKEDWVLCRIFCNQKGNFNSKPKMNTGYDNDMSALLPPLIDRHVVASVVTNFGFGFGFEQVPCFSSFNNHGPTSVGALNWTPPVLPEMGRFQDPIMCDQNVSEVGLASSWNPFS